MKEKCREGKNRLQLYFVSFLCEEKHTACYEFYSVFTIRREPSYRHNVGGQRIRKGTQKKLGPALSVCKFPGSARNVTAKNLDFKKYFCWPVSEIARSNNLSRNNSMAWLRDVNYLISDSNVT
jgi:hypothetical protein